MADLVTVAARAALPIALGMRDAGLDPGPAMAEAGIGAEDFGSPDNRISHDRVVRLWQIATDQSGDADFGLRCASLLAPGDLGVIEYAFRKSASVREGLQRVRSYFRINHDVAGFALSDADGLLTVEHTLPGGRTLPRAAVDFILASPVSVARASTAAGVTPREVYFDYPRPADVSRLQAHFGTEASPARLRFDSDRRAFAYASADADARLLESDPGLCAVLDAHARQVLESRPPVSSLADRVRHYMAAELAGGNPDAQAVADHLRMSVRTLHRRLSDEDTSHKALLEELRQELSTRFLREQAVSISEVAFLLGFSEASAFHRAFKRWTGCTPAQFRSHQANA